MPDNGQAREELINQLTETGMWIPDIYDSKKDGLEWSDVYRCKLGEGATGTVFQGMYKGKKCAIKIYRTGVLPKRKFELQYIREVTLWIGSFNQHPNIVRLLAASITVQKLGPRKNKTTYAVVMEYCSETLFDCLFNVDEADQGFKFGFRDRLVLAYGIANGVEVLHNENCVHRDLKSPNILIKQEKMQLIPKICDLGLLKNTMQTENITTIGSKKRAVGTFGWMAPEVRQHGAHRATQPPDIYSLGMLFYELLAQKEPWHAIKKIDLDDPNGLDKYQDSILTYRPPVDKLSAPWQELLAAMWHQEPHRRPRINDVIGRVKEFIDACLPD